MLKRLSLAAISILILPWLFSQPILVQNTSQAVPFSGIAYAGHTNPGGEACTCGCARCICDAGETPNCPNGNRMTPGGNGSKKSDSAPDLGSAGLIFLLAVFAYSRLR